MELHLDLVGGLAGDMFIAALLDAFPQHESRVLQAISSVCADHPVSCELLAYSDAVLQGRRFEVKSITENLCARVPFAVEARGHEHVTWRSIRERLGDASVSLRSNHNLGMSAGTRLHALGIFQLLADAEAFVHGVEPDSVEFHEVGAWDSLADIVGAAALIDALGATRWSATPAPLGSGRIKTAHGVLAVPAPATVRLLIGMPTLDDGVAGERVTPTGAAILRYLCHPSSGREISAPGARTLMAAGTGFGRRTLPGLSNHVRVLCFEETEPSQVSRFINVLEFEVDDQSGEDLAAGLDRVRENPGVLDVVQMPVFGKKGRIMSHIRVLARFAHLDDVVEACFRETTTIGLRYRSVQGIGLKRHVEEVEVDGTRLRVKVVDRPGGATAKAESDDLLGLEQHARRSSLRQRAEHAALKAAQVEVDV